MLFDLLLLLFLLVSVIIFFILIYINFVVVRSYAGTFDFVTSHFVTLSMVSLIFFLSLSKNWEETWRKHFCANKWMRGCFCFSLCLGVVFIFNFMLKSYSCHVITHSTNIRIQNYIINCCFVAKENKKIYTRYKFICMALPFIICHNKFVGALGSSSQKLLLSVSSVL